jgi:hypothetical protein
MEAQTSAVSHCFWPPFRNLSPLWPTVFREWLPRGSAVASVRRPRSHRSGPSWPLEHHDVASAFTSASASLSRSLQARVEEPSHHRRRALPSGRACLPPHYRPLHHAHSSATTSRTSSTPPLEQPSQGKGALPAFPRSEFTGAPPSSRSSVASAAERSSLSSDSCPAFPFSPCCSRDDVTGPGASVTPRHGRRWCSHAATLLHFTPVLISSRVRFAKAPRS